MHVSGPVGGSKYQVTHQGETLATADTREQAEGILQQLLRERRETDVLSLARLEERLRELQKATYYVSTRDDSLVTYHAVCSQSCGMTLVGHRRSKVYARLDESGPVPKGFRKLLTGKGPIVDLLYEQACQELGIDDDQLARSLGTIL